MSSIVKGAVIAQKYGLERPLAEGGMASIWVGKHLALGLPVAIKFMNAQVAATPDGRVRFEREARAVALLQGSNVVRIHDYGLHDGTPYMVMDLLRGEDLGRRLKRKRRLDLPQAALVVAQVSKALRRAHDAGIIHRDLKPANIFFAADGEDEHVTVLDFGVAKMTGVGIADEVTRTDAVIGSVHYMSPEQARGRRDIDTRSDLWSLGVLTFRMLTAHLPFGGEAATDVLVAICTEQPPQPSQLVPGLGPEVDAFFARALAKSPDERFQTAEELAAAFASIVARASLVSLVAAAPTPPPAEVTFDPPPLRAPQPSAPELPPPPPEASSSTDVSQVSNSGAPGMPRDRTLGPKVVALAVSAALALAVVVAFVVGGAAPATEGAAQPASSAATPVPVAAPAEPSPSSSATVEPAAAPTALASVTASVTANARPAPAPHAPAGPPPPAVRKAAAPAPAKKSERLGLGF